MGSNKTPEVGPEGKLQGIGIHDPRFQNKNLRAVGTTADASDFTEQGVSAGVPEPEGRSNLVLKASGNQTPRTSYTVQARYAGHPLPSDGSFVWFDDNSDDTYGGEPMPYGHDGYQAVTGVNGAIEGKTSAEEPVKPEIVRLHATPTGSDEVLAVYVPNTGGDFATAHYSPDTGKWTVNKQALAWKTDGGEHQPSNKGDK